MGAGGSVAAARSRGAVAALGCLLPTEWHSTASRTLRTNPGVMSLRRPWAALRMAMTTRPGDLRRRNVAADLKKRLNREGNGTRVEINPVDQTRIGSWRQRDLSGRSINVRGVWDRAVDAWMDDDVDELDAVWDIIIEDLGSDYDAYTYVSWVGWAA